jgi:hypothetical protein
VIPFQTAFIDESSAFEPFEVFIEILFFMDLLFNFVTAYVDRDRKVEIRMSVIAKNYIQSWFFLDLFACIPF